jgi:hypothetical protein
MPNWCSNDLIIAAKPEVLADILEKVKGEEGIPFDFDKVVPMPESLRVDDSSDWDNAFVAFYGSEGETMLSEDTPKAIRMLLGSERDRFSQLLERYKAKDAAELQAAILKENPNAKLRAEVYYGNIKQHGHKTWYNWSVEHWGTKWNAAEAQIVKRDEKKVAFRFDTAWGPPVPVVEALGKQFPKAKITLRYYEGGSGFKGELVMKGGEVFSESEGSYGGSRGG